MRDGRGSVNRRLVVLGGEDRQRRDGSPGVALNADRYAIGRSRRCDVRVENDSVSKVHASVVFDRSSGEYYIVDENSRNGTCINGEPLVPGVPAPIWSGAYVSYGDAVFVFIDPPTLRKLSKLDWLDGSEPRVIP